MAAFDAMRAALPPGGWDDRNVISRLLFTLLLLASVVGGTLLGYFLLEGGELLSETYGHAQELNRRWILTFAVIIPAQVMLAVMCTRKNWLSPGWQAALWVWSFFGIGTAFMQAPSRVVIFWKWEKECKEGNGKSCFDYSRTILGADDRLMLTLRSCELKYDPGCKKLCHSGHAGDQAFAKANARAVELCAGVPERGR